MILLPVKKCFAAVLCGVFPVAAIASGIDASGLSFGKNGWLPGHTHISVWTGVAYGQAVTVDNVFDEDGRLSSVTAGDAGSVTRTSYRYNEDGRIVEIVVKDGPSEETLENRSRVVMDYDSVVKDFRTLYEASAWDGSEWAVNERECYDITRDGKGRVSEVTYLYGVEDVDYPEDMAQEMLMKPIIPTGCRNPCSIMKVSMMKILKSGTGKRMKVTTTASGRSLIARF